jgi:hypothetical protein
MTLRLSTLTLQRGGRGTATPSPAPSTPRARPTANATRGTSGSWTGTLSLRLGKEAATRCLAPSTHWIYPARKNAFVKEGIVERSTGVVVVVVAVTIAGEASANLWPVPCTPSGPPPNVNAWLLTLAQLCGAMSVMTGRARVQIQSAPLTNLVVAAQGHVNARMDIRGGTIHRSWEE